MIKILYILYQKWCFDIPIMIIYIIMLPHKHKWQEVDEIIKENKEEAYNKRHI